MIKMIKIEHIEKNFIIFYPSDLFFQMALNIGSIPIS